MYASDLARAFETARIVGAATGVAAEPVRDLREVFLGEWEGRTTEEIAVLEKRDGRTVIAGVNDIGHLEPAFVTEVGPG